jgi:hypothetical protein
MIHFVRIALLVFVCTYSYGQGLHLSAGVEKTAKRVLYGGGLTLESKGKWGIGAFYQTSLSNTVDESLNGKDTFYGALFQIPLAKTEKINFFATARLGMANENFFVVVPGLETRIKTWKKLSTVFGMGYRVGYPAIGLKLSHPIL